MIRWAFDLELEQPNEKVKENNKKFTGPFDSQVSKEVIIEIGAVVFDTDTGIIIDRLEGFVNNGIVLSTFIRGLTGITQEQVDGGKLLKHVMIDLDRFIGVNKAFRQPICWGIDAECLRTECKGTKAKWHYGKAYMNLKSVYQFHQISNKKDHHGGLKVSMKEVGLQFTGNQHRAITDAENTAHMYMELSERMKLK